MEFKYVERTDVERDVDKYFDYKIKEIEQEIQTHTSRLMTRSLACGIIIGACLATLVRVIMSALC